jgi:L-ascorbate metabolism protein UlaG (beta-lactamase superfamily)
MTNLIQPVMQGSQLAEEIRATVPSAGGLCVWWLGQSGFVVKSRFGTLVIDPYLSDSLARKYAGTSRPHDRLTACPILPNQLGEVDPVLSSHKHTDHMDPETLVPLMGANPRAELAVPEALIHHVEKMGVPARRLMGLDGGWTLERAGFFVRAIPSAHEALDTDANGRHLYLGFVVEADGARLYHSGDSVAYDGLVGNLGSDPFDVLFLAINGRDPARGVPGNMTADEALELAAIVNPRFVVPHHYDMFAFNTVPVSSFEDEAARLPASVRPAVLQCGELWEVLP